jgi:TonB family protein
MNSFFIYLLKVSAGLGIIFLPYYFLFRKDPNLLLKRIYLICGVLASWIFPFITFRKLPLAVDLTPTVFIDLDTPVTQALMLEGAGVSSGLSINWLQVLIMVYIAGLIFMFLKNLFLIFKWNLTWQRTHNEQGVAFIKNDQVFTLFTKIFVPGSLQDQDDLDNVLLHEKAHIRQLHFIDLMLMECTLLLTWFNPFSWLISRMIKENHEHLADRQVLSTGIDPARYRAQLMNHTLGVNVFRLGNQFNHSLTLNRFKMMKKPKKSPWGILKIAVLIPAVLFTLGLTTGMTPQQKTVKGKIVLAETGEPVPGASIVIRNGTTGCVSDLDGSFMLNVDGDPELVISFVGMETLIVRASRIGKKPLELKEKTYDLDLESVPLEVKESFYVVDEMPTFNGGDAGKEFRKYIAENLQYPEIATKQGIEGRVIVQFMVNTAGKVQDALVVRSVDPALDKEAIRVVMSSPVWTPGKQGGETVNVLFNFPINFVLQDSKKDETKKSETLTIRSKDGSVSEPVYVVDGKVVDEIKEIDPESIERMEVFKGESDSPLIEKYNAKDGVILITTKEGAEAARKAEEKEVFYIVEDMPQFPGGKAALKTYIYSRLKNSEEAKTLGIEGEVTVQWMIDTKGKTKDVQVLQSTNRALDAAVMKVIREMPDWTPGKQRGKAVNVKFSTKIQFTDENK